MAVPVKREPLWRQSRFSFLFFFELFYLGAKWELWSGIAPQIALRNCSKQAVGEGQYVRFWRRECSVQASAFLWKALCWSRGADVTMKGLSAFLGMSNQKSWKSKSEAPWQHQALARVYIHINRSCPKNSWVWNASLEDGREVATCYLRFSTKSSYLIRQQNMKYSVLCQDHRKPAFSSTNATLSIMTHSYL